MPLTVGGIHGGLDTHANRPAGNAVPDGSLYSCSTHGLIYKSNYAGNSWATYATLGAAASGSITSSGYTQNTAKLLGRTTASSGAIEEISVGTGLTLSAGSLSASGSGATYTGQPLVVTPILPNTGFGNFTNGSAGFGWAVAINVPAPMKVRGMGIEITSNGTGAIEWGLFDGSSAPTAATKVCGGSAAPGGTGHVVIAATSAPVSINPGGYVLIFKNPDTNQSTLRTIVTDSSVAVPWNQIWTSYTWDDTPDLTSASWVVNSTMATIYLEGDLDGSGTRWG